MKNKILFKIVSMFLILVVVVFAGCSNKKDNLTIRMSIGYVPANAPIFVIHDLNLMDKYLKNSKLEFFVSTSGSNTNQALIANQIDGAVLDSTNFLIGREKGVKYKMLSSVSYMKMSLQTNDSSINSLQDIKSNHLIGINSLTGTSTLVLSIAAEKYLGSHNALANQLVVMDAANITLSLANKSGISLAFVNALTRIDQNELGCPTIFEDDELFDSPLFTNYAIFNESFYNKKPELFNTFNLALADAIDLINSRDEEALNSISKNFNIDKNTFIQYLDADMFIYKMNDFTSIVPLAGMAIKMGYISSVEPLEQIVFNQ